MDRLSEMAWRLVGDAPAGWARVEMICDLADRHMRFGDQRSRPTKTAFEAFHRFGRVSIACRRNAADVVISNAFGPNILLRFKARTEQVYDRGAV
jgi:hypothetical protein